MPLPANNTEVEMGQITSSSDSVLPDVSEAKNVVAVTADEIINEFKESTEKLFLEACKMRDAALKLQDCKLIDLEIEKVRKFKKNFRQLFNDCEKKLERFEPLSTTQEENYRVCITRPNHFFVRFLKPLYDRNKELLDSENEKWLQMHAGYRNHGLLRPPSPSTTAAIQNDATLTTSSTEVNQQNLAYIARPCVLL